MEEKDGWKKVRATVPDSRIIIRAAKKAKKYNRHHNIYVRGAHYDYYFEKVAGQNSIIYRRLQYREKIINKRKNLVKIIIISLTLLGIGIIIYLGI